MEGDSSYGMKKSFNRCICSEMCIIIIIVIHIAYILLFVYIYIVCIQMYVIHI